MIVIIGKSGSGKTVAAQQLVEKYGYEKPPAYTSRRPRENEVDGVDYNFCTKEFIEQLIKQDFFAEYVLYNDNYYAYSKEVFNNSDNKVLVVEKDGFDQLKENNIKMISFYIKVDVDTRYRRMVKDNRQDVLSRIENGEFIFGEIEKEVDFVIENEDSKLEECVNNILKLAKQI